jgi:hypothetical protein
MTTSDLALEAYVEAIEAHLKARRGTDHVLSPRDFALARTWHDASVPLATVLVGIDRAFETGEVTSLSYCRRRIEELIASGPRPHSRPSPPAETVPLQEVATILGGLAESLVRLSASRRAVFEPPLRKIHEVQDLVSVASRPNWDYLRAKLREIDDDVSAAVLEALPPDELEAFRGEAARSIERLKGRVDEASLSDAVTRYTVQRGRERLGLPRVSLI